LTRCSLPSSSGHNQDSKQTQSYEKPTKPIDFPAPLIEAKLPIGGFCSADGLGVLPFS
jgi:hypothetical protein